jgi:ABC-type nitrate/sulfonate/bicarbonate transport system permease component
MKRLPNIGDKLIPGCFFLLILAVWQIAVVKKWIPDFILPSPQGVLGTLTTIWPEIKVHLFTTLCEAFLGFTLAIGLSIVLAVGMDVFSIVRKAVYPFLIISQTVPTIILAPLFALWFGFGMLPKVLVVVLSCFFPIVVSLSDGFNSIEQDMVNLFKSMGATSVQVFRYLKLPAAFVNFFSGLRIAAAYCIIGAVVAEWLGGETGLGVYMIRVRLSYDLNKVFATIVIVAGLSLILFQLISFAQNLVMPWNRLKNDYLEDGKDE